MSHKFIQALEQHDLESIKKFPKSDLHNHFVLGGNREHLFSLTGHSIQPCTTVLQSINEMHKWYEKYLGHAFESKEMRLKLLESTLDQANQDGVKVLEIGEDAWGLSHYFNSDIDDLINTFKKITGKVAPNIELRFQIGISRHCSIKDIEHWLEPVWGNQEVYSIDLYGDELSQPIENFIPVYKKAKQHGLTLKVHVGEWGSAEDIRYAVDCLELDEVQHGISAVKSKEVLSYLEKNNIRLNVTPTSNLMLGRVSCYAEHPIRILHRSGIEVTINSDDVLIFDSDVSKEYLRLFKSNTLSAEELNCIRINGLKSISELR